MAQKIDEVISLYCERAGMIVPLEDGFCRSCSGQASDGDGTHRGVEPETLKEQGYVSTPVLHTPAQGGE